MKFLVALFLFASPVFAQLPDKPAGRGNIVAAPFQEAGHTFRDVFTFRNRQFSSESLAYLLAYGADQAITGYNFKHGHCVGTLPGISCPVVEVGPLFKGSSSEAPIALSWGAVYVGVTVISHTLLTHTRNKFSHGVAHTLESYGAVSHTRAAINNLRYM
jgi:hypothetical protein